MTPLVSTYSICACDLAARQWGVAVQSRFLAVGSHRALGGAARRRDRDAVVGEPALRPGGVRAAARRCLGRGGGRASDGGRRRSRATAARHRRRARAAERPSRATSARTGREGGTGTGLRGPGQHPRLGRDGRRARRDLRVDGRATAPTAAARLPRRRTGRGRRPPGQQSAALLVVGPEQGFAGLSDVFVDLRVDDHERPLRGASAPAPASHHELFVESPRVGGSSTDGRGRGLRASSPGPRTRRAGLPRLHQRALDPARPVARRHAAVAVREATRRGYATSSGSRGR